MSGSMLLVCIFGHLTVFPKGVCTSHFLLWLALFPLLLAHAPSVGDREGTAFSDFFCAVRRLGF